jgi:hypothetical protein
VDSRKLRDAEAHRRMVLEVLGALDLEVLHRRGDQVARMDGYPAGASDGPGSGPSIMVRNELGDLERVSVTGTEVAALSRPEPDPVGRWIADVFALLDLMASTAQGIRGRAESVARCHEKVNQAAGAGVCEVCARYCSGAEHDRLRSGYCPADHMAWKRAGRPDRSVFKRERQAREAS